MHPVGLTPLDSPFGNSAVLESSETTFLDIALASRICMSLLKYPGFMKPGTGEEIQENYPRKFLQGLFGLGS
jgi:hypothetical protein